MGLEDTTLWGIVVASCFGIGPVLREVAKHFLSNKVKHTQELDSIRVLEEKNKLEERDRTFEFFKTYLEKKDNEFETLKEILNEIKSIAKENQFTDKRDFQTLVITHIELLFLRLENSMGNIIERNHISESTIETSYKKVTNLIERDINNLTMEINEIHYYSHVKKQVNDLIIYKKEDIINLLKEVITDYVESKAERYEKKDMALKQLREAINYLNNSFATAAQKVTN